MDGWAIIYPDGSPFPQALTDEPGRCQRKQGENQEHISDILYVSGQSLQNKPPWPRDLLLVSITFARLFGLQINQCSLDGQTLRDAYFASGAKLGPKIDELRAPM
jgi:hypothetical protein